MKKVSLFFALVLVASFAMAQKTTTILQAGTNNIADVTQMACSSGDDNFIVATQSGNYNDLTTSQSGWNNNIELTQGGYYNEAFMTQETCDGSILAGSGYNTSNVNQGGTGNKAELSQMETTGGTNDGWGIPEVDRSMNVAHATQSGVSGIYTLDQGRQELIPDNDSYLIQSGNNNTADIDQTGIRNFSEISQWGNYNTADLDQAGAYVPLISTFDESYSWQTGNYNDLFVTQTGGVDEQKAESTQNGIGNETEIEQIGLRVQNVNSWQYGASDEIIIEQTDN